MKNKFRNPVFSLNRFFHKGKKKLPCWLAGRFYPKDKFCFQLKSQNLSIDCERKGHKLSLKTGDWIAVKLLSQKNKVYQVSEYQILSPSNSKFKQADFSYKNKGQIIQDWNSFLDTIKEFFYSEGLTYADTPNLVPCPGTEPHLKPFKTRLIKNNKSKTIYLPTSPEMHLKKLLCQDWTDFFEIKKCYRNGELNPLHQAEFTMLEWYRAFYSTQQLIEESYKLLSFLQKKDFFKVPLPKAKIYTVQELFKKYLNFSLSPQTSKKELIPLLKKHNLIYGLKDDFETLFFNLFLNLIEPKLPKGNPVFVCSYPPQLRAFSQLNEQGWADRFELYWRGFELANAFYEVTDSKEQLSLFKDHIKQRNDSVAFDKELFSLMDQGMPSCSGIAMGLDRLFLAIYKKKNLTETRLFPLCTDLV